MYLLGTQDVYGLQARLADTKFSTGYPAPGSKAGDVSFAVEWSNCTGAKRVEVVLSKTVNGKQVSVGSLVNKTVTKDFGTWTATISGIPSGTVITQGDISVTNGGIPPVGLLAAFSTPPISVTVP